MNSSPPASAAGTAGLAGKYLTVGLGAESYGLNVLQIREIIRLQPVTPVPRMPPEVRGVINLRGRVIPIVDLRAKFGCAAGDDQRACIVVVQVRRAGDTTAPVGLVVDRVEDVATIAGGEIEPTPDAVGRGEAAGLLGLAKVKGQVKTLLDIDRVLAA